MRVERGTDVLRNMGVNGFIGFSVKAEDNDSNRAIIKSFLEFAKVECDNNYTLAIRKLMEGNQRDYLLEVLSGKILELENKLNEVKGVKKKEDDKKNDEVF